MLKNPLLLLVMSFILLQSCGEKDGYKKTSSGLKYKFIVDSAGQNAQLGEALLMDVLIKTDYDSILEESWNSSALIVEPKYKGSLDEAFAMLSSGDSASFKISADSFFLVQLEQPMPPYLQRGSELVFYIKVNRVAPKEEVERELAKFNKMLEDEKFAQIAVVDDFVKNLLDSADIKKQIKKDDILIKNYLKEHNLSMEKTEYGVYYSVSETGNGASVAPGDTVTVHYTGKLLDGKVFDSSQGRSPFTFVLGLGEVIPGWDNGIKKFREGDKGVLIVPSSLGYMDVGIPDDVNKGEYVIPKNAPLIFDVEIVRVGK